MQIEGTDDETTLTVYDTPKEVKEYRYKYPSLSDYRYVVCSKGRVIVEAPDGTQITIFDRSSEYNEYAAQKKLRRRPIAIRQLIIFLVFMALLIWGLDKSIEPAPLDSVYLRSSQNSQPNSDASDVNSRKERGRVFRIARSDPPPAF